MKFIHTGDIHYGMQPDANRPWSNERAQDIKNSLARIIEECRNRKVDFLFISGDLFHRQPILRDIKEVNYLFSSIPDVNIVLIAGNHDRINENSAIHSFPWAKNVYYISSADISSIYFPEKNTEVYGFSYHSYEIREKKLDGVKVPNNGRINILLAHGGDLNHVPFDKDKLAESGFSYCALAHIHKHEVLIKNKVVFCGSPEPLNISETGKHGFYYGEVDPFSLAVKELEFIPSAVVQYITLIVNVNNTTTNTELMQTLEEEIKKRGSQNIYSIKLQGMRDPDIEFDPEKLSNQYKISRITDDSEPEYDFPKLFADHSTDMIGFFIQELNKPDISSVDKKALYYGVNALLRTIDERS